MLNFKKDKKNEINQVLFLQIFKMLTFQNFKFFKKSYVGCPPFLFCFFRIACFCSYISQISCVCFLLNISIFQQQIQKKSTNNTNYVFCLLKLRYPPTSVFICAAGPCAFTLGSPPPPPPQVKGGFTFHLGAGPPSPVKEILKR